MLGTKLNKSLSSLPLTPQIQSVQTPQRTEKRKQELYQKFICRFNEQLNPKRVESVSLFIEKTLQNYIFKENRILGSKEISQLEAMIVQFQKNLSQNSLYGSKSIMKKSGNSQRLAPIRNSNLDMKLKTLEQSLQERNQALLDSKQQKYSNVNKRSMSQEYIPAALINDKLQEGNIDRNSQQSKSSVRSQLSMLNPNVHKDQKLKTKSSTQNLFQPFSKRNQNTIDYDQISLSSTQSNKSVVMLSQQGKNWDEYAAILDYNTRKYYESIEEKKQQKKQKQKQFMEDLQKQMQENKKKKDQEKQKERYFHSLEIEQQDNYDQKEQEKVQKWQSNQNNILKKLDQQVNLKSYLDKKEKKQELKYEKSLVDLYKQKLQEETQKNIAKKEKDIQFMNKVWKESLLEREKIENEQKDLLKMDKEGSNMHGKILREQHIKREEEKVKRLKKCQEVVDRWDNVIENQKIEADKKEQAKEKLLQRYQQEEEDKVKQIEDEKLNRVKRLRDQMLVENSRQISMKNTFIDPLKRDRIEQGRIWVQEDRQYAEGEQEKLRKQREKTLQYQRLLEQQIKNQERIKQRELMNKQELLQNKSLLKEISADQRELMSKMQSSQEAMQTQNQMNSSGSRGATLQTNLYSSYSNDPKFGKNLTLKSVNMQECDRV